MRGRRLFFFFLVGLVAFAEEKPAPPAERRELPPDDGIAVAKREFDAVKSMRGDREPAKLELGGLSAPELQVGGPAPRALPSASEAALAAQKKAANWLLDAMSEKDKKLSGSDAHEKKPGERELDKGKDDLLSFDGKEPLEIKKPTESVTNPLDRYMAGWMSPQDFSLLRPVLGRDSMSEFPDRKDSSLAGLSGGLRETTPIDSLGLLSGGAPAVAMPAAPRENPFLQGFAPPTQPMSQSAPPATGSFGATTPAPSLLAPPPPPAGQKSLTPDFVKPRNDEKYYKQMKRF